MDGAIDLVKQRRIWAAGPDWEGCDVAILASGPSMDEAQADAVRKWRLEGDGHVDLRRRVIAINTTYRLALWADLLYACDGCWWDQYAPAVHEAFRGETWTQDRFASEKWRIRCVQAIKGEGLGREPGLIHQGMNSGYQAMNLAWQAGAARLILLGFDMRKVNDRDHWHGSHPGTLARNNPYEMWVHKFERLAVDLADEGCAVANCTPGSALTAFPRMPLDEALRC